MTIRFPRVEVIRYFHFRASHCLPKSKNPYASKEHKHTYKVGIILDHEVNPNNNGWAMDFDEIDSSVIDPLKNKLEGSNLNEVIPFAPTSEMVACWILCHCEGFVTGITLQESGRSQVRVERIDIRPEWTDKFKKIGG